MVAAVTAVRVSGQPAAGDTPGPSAEPGCGPGGAGSVRATLGQSGPSPVLACLPARRAHSGGSPRGGCGPEAATPHALCSGAVARAAVSGRL